MQKPIAAKTLIPRTSARKATNLTIDSALLAEAKSLGINISRACENHLLQVVREEKERQWKDHHAGFVEEYNALVDRDELPLDQWRQF